MRLPWLAVIVIASYLEQCQGVIPLWGDLTDQHSACLGQGEVCSRVEGRPACCTGLCCSSGLCGVCAARQAPSAGLRKGIFSGFDQREFEFPETANTVFNLISEADHQLNALLFTGNGQAQELGITCRGVGIHGPDTNIRVASSYGDTLVVEVNGQAFTGNSMRLDGVTISKGCAIKECSIVMSASSAVTVADSFMTLWIWAEQSHTQPSVGRLAFKTQITGQPMTMVHGILGQTFDEHDSLTTAAADTQVHLPTNFQFYGEGQALDYSVSDLFASDSVFSLYTRKMERRRHRRKRTMLEGSILASAALASRENKGAQEHAWQAHRRPAGRRI